MNIKEIRQSTNTDGVNTPDEIIDRMLTLVPDIESFLVRKVAELDGLIGQAERGLANGGRETDVSAYAEDIMWRNALLQRLENMGD